MERTSEPVVANIPEKPDFQIDIVDRPAPVQIEALLQEVPGLHPLVAGLMVQRGLKSYAAVRSFFSSEKVDPGSFGYMADMDSAVDRLIRALDHEELILLYGDYDVDGTCAVAMMYNYLRDVGANVLSYQPDRYREGYGVSREGIAYASQKGAGLIITLDCGILAHDRISEAVDMGMDVIICDHHLPHPTLPPAVAVLNPNRPDCPFDGNELCGCGVAYMLLTALQAKLGHDLELLRAQLPLVAVATCSDIVPLTGINRMLVREGLEMMKTDCPAALAALLRVAAHSGPLTVSDVVFKIGPRINAAGRLDHASIAFDLLTASNAERIEEGAARLEQLNTQRRSLDKKITGEALSLMLQNDPELTRHSTVVAGADWHKGVIGIIASRLTEWCYRPTIVFTEVNGTLTGSARSVDGFHLHEAISRCSHHLVQFGGHAAAAGLTIRKENLPAFSDDFEAVTGEMRGEASKLPRQWVDLEVKFSDWYNEGWPGFFKQMSRMRPYGPGNYEPVFMTRGCKARAVQPVGAGHIRFTAYHSEAPSHGLPVIAFNQISKYDSISAGAAFSLIYTIGESHWQGRTSLQLHAKAIIVE